VRGEGHSWKGLGDGQHNRQGGGQLGSKNGGVHRNEPGKFRVGERGKKASTLHSKRDLGRQRETREKGLKNEKNL